MEADGYDVTRVAPRSDGSIDADAVLSAVRPDTALVSVMLVNNELGNRYPVEEIAQGLRVANPETLLHTDAVQGFLKVPFSARTSGADFVTVSAHKIGGPKGIGALYIGERVRNPRPLLPGGGQESGFRSGTEATAQIAGFAKAAELRAADLSGAIARMADIRAYAVERLSEIPDLRIISPDRDFAPHILAVALTGWPSQNIVNDLSAQGICVSAGSACHKGKPSHVVKALSLPKRVQGSVIRLSFGYGTSRADIDAAADALRRHHDERFPML
jgi:cysteine desulfurase